MSRAVGAGALVYSTDGSWDDPSAQPPWIQLEGMVIGNELSRLFRVEERHRRLFARLVVALGLSLVVFVIGTVAMWALESGRKGGDIHGVGDSAFFTAVQLLTVSSSFSNPLTAGGKIVDVFLELWAILVVTAVTGSFATFFTSGDS